jgi:hypothetical protein
VKEAVMTIDKVDRAVCGLLPYTIRYQVVSILTGCLWGALAFLIGHKWMPGCGVAAISSPFIGLLIGRVYRPVFKLSRWPRAVLSIVALYLSAAIFGIVGGAYQWMSHSMATGFVEIVLVQPVLATWWYLTLVGFFWIWPLAILNFFLLGRFCGVTTDVNADAADGIVESCNGGRRDD